MSEMRAKLTSEMKNCLKSGEKEKLKVVRMLITEIKNAEINDPKERGRERTDAEVSTIITGYHKLLTKTMQEYPEDRKAEIKKELAIVEEFMPRQLSEDEVVAALQALVSASEDKNFGTLMKQANEQLKGQTSGQLIAKHLKPLLAK